jgi:hypothetical protein
MLALSKATHNSREIFKRFNKDLVLCSPRGVREELAVRSRLLPSRRCPATPQKNCPIGQFMTSHNKLSSFEYDYMSTCGNL